MELTCRLPRSKPQPSVTWRKASGTTVVNSSRFEILLYQDISKLVISLLELEDAGVYTCEAANVAGNRSDTVILSVKGMYVKGSLMHFVVLVYSRVHMNTCVVHTHMHTVVSLRIQYVWTKHPEI